MTTAPTKQIHVIYGTQTGNAEEIAHQFASIAKSKGYLGTVLDMEDVEAADIANMERLLVITSTYGDGEMPDNADMLWEAVNSKQMPRLNKVNYSVLALGDSGYEYFCLAGIKWDQCLFSLGAKCILARVDCDIDYEQCAQQWMCNALESFLALDRNSKEVANASQSGLEYQGRVNHGYSRKSPVELELIAKNQLTGSGSSKQTIEYRFSLGEHQLTYDTGDLLYVIAKNNSDYVDALLKVLELDGEEKMPSHAWRSLREILINDVEIRLPNAIQVRDIAKRANNPQLNALLKNGQQQKLMQFLYGKDWLDLLSAKQLEKPYSATELLAILRPIIPRAYSISSCMDYHPQQVHLTVTSLRYMLNNRLHNGTCSCFLADDLEVGQSISCYFAANKSFALPQDYSIPIIMIGPGVGVAPFIGFLEQRKLWLDQQYELGYSWLFFGERNRETDYIYQQLLQQMQDWGALDCLDTAFSRDQEQKIYVQHKMLEQGEKIYDLLQQGAIIYVCGDAFHMAKDVEAALIEIIKQHANLDDKAANAYLAQLRRDKRYQKDVF